MRAPSAAAASFTQTISSATYSRPANLPKPQSVLAIPSDKFQVLDKIRGGIEDAGHQQHVFR